MNVPHTCHWPDCKMEVHPRFLMCKSHWWTLPKSLRDLIYRHYRPGQEISKNPSPAYLEAWRLVREWIDNYRKENALLPREEAPS